VKTTDAPIVNAADLGSMIEQSEYQTASLLEKTFHHLGGVLTDEKYIKIITVLRSENQVKFWQIYEVMLNGLPLSPKDKRKWGHVQQEMLKYPIDLRGQGRKDVKDMFTGSPEVPETGLMARLGGMLQRKQAPPVGL